MKAHVLTQRGGSVYNKHARIEPLGKEHRVFGNFLAVFGKVYRAKNLLDILHGKLLFPPVGRLINGLAEYGRPRGVWFGVAAFILCLHL